MTAGAFSRLAQSVLRHLGEDAFLRGAGPYKVVIEHGVRVHEDASEAAYVRSIATILSSLNPSKGDSLVVGSKSYKLEMKYEDDGETESWILLET